MFPPTVRPYFSQPLETGNTKFIPSGPREFSLGQQEQYFHDKKKSHNNILNTF